MKHEKRKYSQYKKWPKRLRQALFRLCIYGSLLVAGEVAFYSITKIGRKIPVLKYLFQYNWLVDPKLNLGQIWNVPVSTFYGQASLYMFFVYGLICVVGLEPSYRWMKKKDFPILLRGFFYMLIILEMECLLGWILFWLTGYEIWYYTGWGSFPVFTSLAIAPMWFICGLISENVINVFDSFDNLKLAVYGLAINTGTKKVFGNKIAVLSDVHIGLRESPSGSCWFKGIYPVYLNIILYKIALDSRISKLILLGDFFDTWLCPADKKPFANAAEIINAWQDALFMPALKKCIELCNEVWYIPGNHDMGITQNDLDTISVNGRKIILKTPGTYSTELLFNRSSPTKEIRFEHGNAADLFNASVSPEDTDTIQGLPFGYFVTRLAAESDRFDMQQLYKKTYASAFKTFTAWEQETKKPADPEQNQSGSNLLGKYFIELFVDGLIDLVNTKRDNEHKITEKTVIKMSAPYTDVAIADVKNSYHSLLKKYEALLKTPENLDKPDEFHRYYIFATEQKGLYAYAHEKFGKKNIKLWFYRIFRNQPPEKIVIMGHTHYAVKEYITNTDTAGIYANSGCICSCKKQKTPSWIEIVNNAKRGCLVKVNYL
jgi:UDP-2,3-diacylglucosamine pyrophosphatase LpxH